MHFIEKITCFPHSRYWHVRRLVDDMQINFKSWLIAVDMIPDKDQPILLANRISFVVDGRVTAHILFTIRDMLGFPASIELPLVIRTNKISFL